MNLVETVEARVVHTIHLLCQKIRLQGFTEAEVAEALNWNATYFKDLRSESPELYFDDLLFALHAIGIEPQPFFTELFGRPKSSDPPAELTRLSRTVECIAELLIKNGHFTAGDLARASAADANRNLRRRAKALAKSPKPRKARAARTTGAETRP